MPRDKLFVNTARGMLRDAKVLRLMKAWADGATPAESARAAGMSATRGRDTIRVFCERVGGKAPETWDGADYWAKHRTSARALIVAYMVSQRLGAT